MFRPFFPMSKTALSILSLFCISLHSQVSAADALSFHIDYKESCTELCRIGAQYDTDKSSQRAEVMGDRHCHPYTLFYDALLKDKRDEYLVIGELGILFGSSLLMWKNYFTKAVLYGFEYDLDLINIYRNKYNQDRTNLFYLNVWDQSNIIEAFRSTGTQYDLIIDDTTHLFEDQLRVIENVHPFLKPGGMLIIEDVFESNSEQGYIDRLQPVLDRFQDFYFVSMDHKNRYSGGCGNDKVFVLVKVGGDPIFKKKKKMTIITPSAHPSNLLKIKDSIDFSYVDEWIIVYDGSKVSENPHLFTKNPKISEYIHTGTGAYGNSQRNYALDHIQNEDTYLYFLDNDNLMEQDLYKLLDIIDDDRVYTFDLKNELKGDNIKHGCIDTAMFLVDFQLCKTLRWTLDEPDAGFYYIDECISNNKDKWVYVNNDLCTRHALPKGEGG